MKALAARSLLAGHVPWWDPFTLGGSPFVANLQSQVFYPPNWLFLVLPLGWGLSVFSALHLALAGLGALALARVTGRSLPASVLAGVATTSCGFVV